MTAFRYEAVDNSGKTKTGVLNADSARAARAELRAQGLLPLMVEAISSNAASPTPQRRFFKRERLTSTELSLFTRQLASLLEAGLPLEHTLTALLEQAERHYVRDLIAALRADVISGNSFSSALAQHPRDFSDIYRALVASGEQVGQLSRVLARLADYIERRNTLMQKVRLAFTYPTIVACVAFLIVLFLLTYVVPQIVSVFADRKQSLPMLTDVMLAISNFVRHYGIYMLLLGIGGGILWQFAQRNPNVKRRWHAWRMNAPLYGRFERSLNTARFASTLAITAGSGVPILQALRTSRDTLNNVALRELVDDATASVREGSSLARALSRQKTFPPLLIHMIHAGEITGELPSMLERAANIQEQELERRALSMASILEPALILVMGAIVLVIVLAVLMPIIEINQLVR